MKVDLLTQGDIAAATALSAAQEWNQTAADWQRLVRLEPSGCFAARDGDRLIGTVTTTLHGSSVAWLGMMIVDADFRRRGVGTALMRRAIEVLQSRVPTVKRSRAKPSAERLLLFRCNT